MPALQGAKFFNHNHHAPICTFTERYHLPLPTSMLQSIKHTVSFDLTDSLVPSFATRLALPLLPATSTCSKAPAQSPPRSTRGVGAG